MSQPNDCVRNNPGPVSDDVLGAMVHEAVGQMPVVGNRDQFIARVLARAAVTPQNPAVLAGSVNASEAIHPFRLWTAFLGGVAVGCTVLIFALSMIGTHWGREQGPMVAWLQIIMPGNGLWE